MVDAWRRVQVDFKNKPADAIYNINNTERNRRVNVFGRIDEDRLNYESCHILHQTANSKSSVSWNNVWARFTGAPDELADGRGPFQLSADEPFKTKAFYETVCVESGIFSAGCGVFALYDVMLPSGRQYRGDRFDTVFKRVFDRFAGCVDCNSKMTLNEFPPLLFKLVFPHDSYRSNQDAMRDSAPQKKFDTASSMYYLMLSGLLRRENVDADAGTFGVADMDHRRSWKFRFVAIWCQLQILFCLWKWASTPQNFMHHTSYIYTGTADFYMALLFFAMHRASDMFQGRGHFEFETFHYFFTSLYPEYIRHRSGGDVSQIPFNLSLTILLEDGVDDQLQFWACPLSTEQSSRDESLTKVRAQLQRMQVKIKSGWEFQIMYLSDWINLQFKLPTELMPPYNQDTLNLHTMYGNFFSSRATVENILAYMDDKPLNLDAYIAALTPALYWFHFKHITQLAINALCDQCDNYYEQAPIPNSRPAIRAAHLRLWRQWYNVFHGDVQMLGGGFDAIPYNPPNFAAAFVQRSEVRNLLRAINELRGKH